MAVYSTTDNVFGKKIQLHGLERYYKTDIGIKKDLKAISESTLLQILSIREAYNLVLKSV